MSKQYRRARRREKIAKRPEEEESAPAKHAARWNGPKFQCEWCEYEIRRGGGFVEIDAAGSTALKASLRVHASRCAKESADWIAFRRKNS